MNTRSIEKEIMEYTSYCINVVTKLRNEIKGKYRTRARSLYELIAYSGIPLSMAYIFAKSSEELLLKCYEQLLKDYEKSIDINEVVKNVENILRTSGDEEASYALYGASIIFTLSKLTAKKFSSMDELILHYSFDRLTRKRILEIAKWLKLFAEAKLPVG